MRLLTIFALPLAALPLAEGAAHACGCFAQPNPVQRVVQAGERIVFAQRGPRVEMHVQVNYSGDAEDFGWLLPVPNEPDLSPGTDELFARLDGATAPRFVLDTRLAEGCSNIVLAGGASDSGSGVSDAGAGSRADAGAAPPSPVVSRQDVGAFDAVVLRADDPTAMFDWLNDNQFIVPVGPEDDVIQRYVGEGRFFVALKLRANQTTGDIQPIVLEFDAGGPMIPITLTRVGAVADLPVVVWVFGDARAIPRNYRHTVINEEYIQWFRGGRNYVDVVTAAVDEAEGAHSFVTEYAQPTTALGFQVAGPGRFGERADIASVTHAQELVDRLSAAGFAVDAKLINLLRDFVPYPDQAREQGIAEDDFYGLLFFYLGTSQQIDGSALPVDGAAVAEALWTEIVEPTREAQALLDDFDVVTRLFTTLSPDEMTLDPAFDFGTDLPDVDRMHRATFTLACDADGNVPGSGWLELPDGRRFFTDTTDWQRRVDGSQAPYSRRIQALYMDRPPADLVDNASAMTPSDSPLVVPDELRRSGGSGCLASPAPWALPLLTFLGFAALRRRRA